MALQYPNNINDVCFPSCIHRMAYIQYGHQKDDKTIASVNHIIGYLTDSKVGILKKIYLNGTSFTRHRVIKKYWNENIAVDEEENKLRGNEVNILQYLLEMLCLEDCQLRRKKQLKKKR